MPSTLISRPNDVKKGVKMQSTSVPSVQTKWYKGDKPTWQEAMGRAYQIAETDHDRGVQLVSNLRELRTDPNSMFYNRYAAPTNKAKEELAALGVNADDYTSDWFNSQEASDFMSAYLERSSTSDSAKAPTKKSSWENRVAYWLDKWGAGEAKTQAAEKEYQGIMNDARFMAGNQAWNYSDDEIIDRIYGVDGENLKKNYPTLYEMYYNNDPKNYDSDYKAIMLNRAVDFSEDALRGAMWEGRNPDYNGGIEGAMAFSYMGKGNTYKENPEISAKLEPLNPDGSINANYHPYSMGSTIAYDDAKFFGIYGADDEWLEQNQRLKYYGTEEEQKHYNNIETAVNNQHATDAAVNAVNDYANYLLDTCDKPEDVIDKLDTALAVGKLYVKTDKNGNVKYSTKSRKGYEEIDLGILNDIDASVGKYIGQENQINPSGKLVPLSVGTNYKYDDMVAQIGDWWTANTQKKSDAETANDLASDLTVSAPKPVNVQDAAAVSKPSPVYVQEKTNGTAGFANTAMGADATKEATEPAAFTEVRTPTDLGPVEYTQPGVDVVNGTAKAPGTANAMTGAAQQVASTGVKTSTDMEPIRYTEAEIEQQKIQNKKILEASDTVGDIATDNETTVMKNAGSVTFDANKIKFGWIRNSAVGNQAFADALVNVSSKEMIGEGLDKAYGIAEYANVEANYETDSARFNELQNKYGPLEYLQKEFEPTITVSVEGSDGDTYDVTLEFKDIKKGYQVSDVYNTSYVFGESESGIAPDVFDKANAIAKEKSSEALKVMFAQRNVHDNYGEAGEREVEEYKNLSATLHDEEDYLNRNREDNEQNISALKKSVEKMEMQYAALVTQGLNPSKNNEAYDFLNDMLNYHDEPQLPRSTMTKLQYVDWLAEMTGDEYTTQEKSEKLHGLISKIDENIQKIQDEFAYAKEIGYQIPDRYAHNMELSIKLLENQRKGVEYSTILTDTNQKELDNAIQAGKEFEQYLKDEDVLIDDAIHRAFGFENLKEVATEEDEKTYYYLLGKQALERGDEFKALLHSANADDVLTKSGELLQQIMQDSSDYLDYMYDDDYGVWTSRTAEANRASGEAMVNSGFLGGATANIIGTLLTGAESLASALYIIDKAVSGEQINPDSKFRNITAFKESTREATRKSIDEYYKDNPVAKYIANIGYEVYCNRGDSIVNAMLTGSIFSGGGILNEFAGSAPMGATAGLTAAANAIENGASTEQAWFILGANFVGETFFEAVTYSNIREIMGVTEELTKDTLKQFALDWVKKNGIEEMIGEVATNVFENYADQAAVEWFDNPNYQSEHQKRVDAYYAQGYTGEGEAEAKALEEEMKGYLHTAFVSYLSAGTEVAMKAVKAASNTVKTGADIVNGYRSYTRQRQQMGFGESMFDYMKQDVRDAIANKQNMQEASGQEAGAAAPVTAEETVPATAEERYNRATQAQATAEEALTTAKADYDTAYTDERMKRRALNKAKDALAKAEKSGNQERIASAQADVDTAQQEYNAAKAVKEEARSARNAASAAVTAAQAVSKAAIEAYEAEKATPEQKQAAADVVALGRVENSSRTAQTEMIASILDNGEDDAEASDRANAAATFMPVALGNDATFVMQQVITGASRTGVDLSVVKTALQNAALGDGAATSVVQSEEFRNATPEVKAQIIAETILQDQNNPTVQQNISMKITDFRSGMVINGLAAQGHFDQANEAKKKAEVAAKETYGAKKELDARSQSAQAANEAAVEANNRVVQENASDDSLHAQDAALAKANATEEVEKQAKQHLANTEQAQQEAEATAQKTTEDAMASARETANQTVMQENQQREADALAKAEAERKQAAEQAEAERQQKIADNRSGKTAEESARAKIQRLAEAKGYTGEQAEQFVNDVMNFWQTGQVNKVDLSKQFGKSEGYLMMGALSRRFGINVEITDIPSGENGYYDPSTNTITLNSNLPAGQVLVEFALHELTHSLESTGSYQQYHDTVLSTLYPSEAELNDAIAKKMTDYEEKGHPIDETQAKRELVAEFTRLKLNDKSMVQRMVDAGMGGAIRNALHNVNQFMKNLKLTGEARTKAENLRRTERMFQKAIRERARAQQKANADVHAQQSAEVENSVLTDDMTDAQRALVLQEAGIEQNNTEGDTGIPNALRTGKMGNQIPSAENSVADTMAVVNSDAEYQAAVERGDLEAATSMLMEKLKNTEGVIPFMAPSWHTGESKEIAENLKRNDPEAIEKAASAMAKLVPDNAVLIPMPGSNGMVEEGSWTMNLTNRISDITGRPVVVALEGNEHESRQKAKQKGDVGPLQEELGFRKIAEIPEGTIPIFIDNTVGSGVTADAARVAMGGGMTLAYTKTLLSKGIPGLKNAVVTYESKKNGGALIPLSQRFDTSKRDVRYSTGESSDMTDAQYMQALEEAGVDYMSAVARGDMKAAQEDVDFYSEQKGYVNDGFHGTLNGGFTVFDKQKAHIGGNSGAGFYFSSNPDDSEANYSDIEGADNHFKVEHLAEKIQDYIAESGENEYAGVQIPEDASFEDLKEIAKKMLTGSPQTYHVRLNPGRAYIRNFNNSTNLIEDVYDSFDDSDYNMDDYNSDDEYEEAIWEGRSDALYEAISNAVYNGIADVDSNFEIVSNVDYESIISSLAMQAMDYDSLTWDDVSKVIGEQYIDALVGDGEESADATMEITRAIVEAFGFDSIEDREVGKKFNQLKNMGAGDTVHYIMFRPDQIKLADPVTYDNDGNVIPLEKRFSNSLDIRYSAGNNQMTDAERSQALIDAGLMTEEEAAAEQAANRINIEGLTDAENEMLSASLPRGDEGNGQRQWGRQGAQQSDELDSRVKEYLLKNNMYTKDTNEEQVNRALNWIRNNRSQGDPDGYYASLQQVNSKKFNPLSPDGQAKMVAMMAMAAAKNDLYAQVQLADTYNRQGTLAGQTLQARKLFRLMTPEGRIATLQKMLGDVQTEVENRGGDGSNITFSEWIYRAAAAAETEDEFSQVRDAAAAELGAQLPANWKEKLTGFRMLAMLGNPRTHIRNIAGNALFMPAVGIKNKVGAVLESMFLDEGERTKTIGFASKEAREFAKDYSLEIEDVLRGEAKYNDQDIVRQNAKTWGTGDGIISRTIGKALQAYSDLNGNALEWEDWIFLRRHFRNALAGYMTANKLTAADMTGETLENAASYAINEAQKATYRDPNSLATALGNIANKGQGTKLQAGAKAVQGVINAVLPFKKTPANILRRGVEYSPVGLASSVKDVKAMVDTVRYQEGKTNKAPKRTVTPAQFIDKIASGLTGSGVMALGFALARAGVARGGFDYEDPEDKIAQLEGEQEYGVNFEKLGNMISKAITGAELFGEDVTRTMDWAAPMSMPFFVGVVMNDIFKNANPDDDDETLMKKAQGVLESLLSITEPVFNLSMLDGVNRLFKIDTSNSKAPALDIAFNIALNYASSYVPTILGQVARTIDPTRRATYVESGAFLRQFWKTVEQVQNKIPGASSQNIPYMDAFGREQTNTVFSAALENFLAPWYKSELDKDDVTQEIKRVYNETKVGTFIPDTAPKQFKIGKTQYKLTDKEYEAFQKDQGETWYNAINDLIKTDEYQMADDVTKAGMLDDCRTYAMQSAKYHIDNNFKADKWVTNAMQSGNVTQTIINNAIESNRKEFITDYSYQLAKALYTGDDETAETLMEGLEQAKVSDSYDVARKAITEYFKPIYQEADEDERDDIEEMLMDLDFGYRSSDIHKWAVGTKNEDEEEEDEEEYDNSRWLQNNSSSVHPARFIASAGMSDSSFSNRTASMPERPASDNSWDQYMSDLDDYWADYDFASNDPVGQYGQGNIDLDNRQTVQNDDGSISTEQSFSFYDEQTGKEVLIPLVADGRVMTQDEAIDRYYETGEYLGMFDDWHDADEYAMMLHNRQDWYYHQ